MAKFLTRSELYRLIQRELPEDVYPDSGTESTYFSTAESAAEAQIIANAYAKAKTAYDNYFPQLADADAIGQHEIARFGVISTGLGLQARRDRVLAKMRALPSMSNPDLTALVRSFLPSPVTSLPNSSAITTAIAANGLTPAQNQAIRIDLVRWNSYGNTWIIGVSLLGVDTILGGGMRAPAAIDVCQYTAADFGITAAELLDMRRNSYTYEVRIYEDFVESITAQELADIETELTNAEPARSQHIIVLEPLTKMALLAERSTTTLHLVADDWDGGATWYDQSPAANHAARVGVPTKAASQQFYQRYAIKGAAGVGFHAPGDDFNATTKRTYEVLLDDNGQPNMGGAEAIVARADAGGTQYGNILYQGSANIEASIYNAAGSNIWMGSDKFTMGGSTRWGLPVLFHVVMDAVARTVSVWRNGVQLTQVDNPLNGSLATPAGLALGILGRWNGSTLINSFSGTVLEVLRHEEKFTAGMIAARVAEFNRLRGY